MDRIIYFYGTRKHAGEIRQEEGGEPCRIYRYRRKDYELIRVGLEPWILRRWETAEDEGVLLARSGDGGRFGKKEEVIGEKRSLWRGISERLYRPLAKKKYERALREENDFWRKTLGGMVGMIAETIGNSWEDCFYSCDESLRKLFEPGEGKNHPAREVWESVWRVPEFDAFLETQWVEHMLEYAALPHFLILGYHPAILNPLCGHAQKMKSLKWILPKRYWEEELQDFVEDFYQEYGLAVAVELLEEGISFKRAGIASRMPVNILDFSGEAKIPSGNIEKDSIWLDMDSMEEKQRRLERRDTQVHYFSLKKEWKQPVLP